MKSWATAARGDARLRGLRADEQRNEEFLSQFTALELVTRDSRRVALLGPRPDGRSALTAEARRDLGSGKTFLSTEHPSAGPARVFLSRALDPAHPDRGTLHAEVKPAYLWDFEELPPDTTLVVLDQSGRLLGSSSSTIVAVPTDVAGHATRASSGQFEWSDGANEYVATHWALFLRANFRAPEWTIILSQSKADVLAPIADFKRTFVLVALASVWMVLLLSIWQIRRSLTPLERLQEGTGRIATGDFDSRVEVASGDEFEELAASFNRMAGQLGRQFNALAMRGEISVALNRDRKRDEILQECADILASRLLLAAVGVWTLDSGGTTLELRASAGAAQRSEGAHRRIPVGRTEIGLVAEERRPHATNSLLEDPRLSDREWAAREGLVAFVGHPLVVEDRLVGVAAAFATHSLDVMDLSSFASGAGEIAQCIERKRVEEALQGSRAQVRQLQKMEAVGRLAGGIAHDFNNLLTVISGHSQLLLRELGADDPSRGQVEVIEATADRAALLTRQLLAFSRKQVLAPAVLDLNDVVPSMTGILQRLIGENLELVFRPGPALGRVRVDPGQLEQVIVNLVVNARDAMPEGGRITLETSNVDLDDEYARRHGGASPGPHVRLTVADTGTGMDAETQSRIFEPFFTTKAPGQGTGLGLATVYGVVSQSGGSIAVASEPGVGSTFTIDFPRVEEALEPVAAAPGLPPSRGHETVLVVEDESGVRALVRRVLEKYGYAVLSASHGIEALAIAQRHAGPIHLLVTDMVMPEMSGTALAERLRSLRPQVAILVMSGYTDNSVFSHGRLRGDIPFLQKPFTPEALARKVRAVLDSPRSV
jgi:signal transduction histidine kinase